MTHSQRWIATLLDGLDRELDDKTKEKILENCGRTCISRGFLKRIQGLKKGSKDEEDFLRKLGQEWKHLRREGEQLYVTYEKCYCPMVRNYYGKLSSSFCNCSRGWIKELFETTMQKPVEVVLEKSIKRGDEICRFRVQV